MKIFPAVHYTMGGLWTDFTKDEKTGGLKPASPLNMATNIPGLYAMGECSFAYHGANRLGANSLLSCIFDGLFGAPGVRNYCTDVAEVVAEDVSQGVFDAAVQEEEKKQKRLLDCKAGENPYLLWQEMGKVMTDACTVVRHNDRLDRAAWSECEQWKDRYTRVQLSDTGMWTNQNLSFARALGDMILMAEAILKGARLRDESRGAHYKPAFPDRDDVNFLKTTIATFNPQTGSAKSRIRPSIPAWFRRPRTYGKKAEASSGRKSSPRRDSDHLNSSGAN